MTEQVGVSAELDDLITFAFDQALLALQPSGPLAPFAVLDKDTGYALARPGAEFLEDGIDQARQIVREFDEPLRAVVVFDGYSEIAGTRMDTIFVEAYEHTETGGIVVAQSYKTGGLLKKRTDWVGSRVALEMGTTPLFS